MNTRLKHLWDVLRSSYWFVPSLMTLGSVPLWLCMRAIDHLLQANSQTPILWLFTSNVSTAQTLLLAVAGATIGVVGVVFSITMVPLTIAASQFGPRLLRNFLRDLGTQIVLGIFIATFAYCMLVLLALNEDQPLPQVMVTMSLVLAAIGLGALIYYISHIAIEIQAPHVLAEVADELFTVIDEVFPEPYMASIPVPPLPPTTETLPILALTSGYVQAIDTSNLIELATEHDLVIHFLHMPGQFVTAHAPLAHVWPASADAEGLTQQISNACILGPQRTLVQDVEFGINSLVEVAVRALSPAINDPFTAMTGIDWLGAALCRLCARAQPRSNHYDAEGQLRLIVETMSFRQLTDAAFNLIREYGRSSATVSNHMLKALAIVGGCARTDEQRAALRHHAELIKQDALASFTDPFDRERMAEEYDRVITILAS